MEFSMKKLFVLCVLFFAFIASASPATAAPGGEIIFNETFRAKELCQFPVQLVVTGKSNFVDLPGDRFFVGSPGQVLTVTNLDTGEQVTYLITGTTHATVQADGTTVFKVTGLNVVFNPREVKSEEMGIFVLEGNFTFALTSKGTESSPYSGIGDVTDVCAELA
ncbi:putative uncharacterized protein [Pseudarthrobacter siccitolerans]|uniref:FecR protein domain-containing protein n=2 Tax=Pseudarthrobacter siccitolerans TaxID=861266 RepID=A0A024H027_9MICC|nr:putative uncharacterized protein [Pseudarthrobacter siccitolerans]